MTDIDVTIAVNKVNLTVGTDPVASAIAYGQKLSDSTLTGGSVVISGTTTSVPGTWGWVDGNIQPTSGSYAVRFTPDDPNNFNTIADQDVSVTVNAVTPALTITPDHFSQVAGKTVTVTVTAANPNDSTMTDVPTDISLTYTIGNDTQSITNGSFTIPAGTAVGTTITITATSDPVTGKYLTGTNSATVTVTDKIVPELTVSLITMTYNGSPVPDSMISGTAKDGDTVITGTWAFASGQTLTDVADSGAKTVVFTPSDTTTYTEEQTTEKLSTLFSSCLICTNTRIHSKVDFVYF